MDVATHLEFFAKGLDPVIWLRVVRIALFLVCAVLMYKEPMICGGQNKFLHRMLALLFLGAAAYSWVIAKARMIVLLSSPEALSSFDILIFELIYSAVVLAMVIKLGYDYFKWIGYNRIKRQGLLNNCPHRFEP